MLPRSTSSMPRRSVWQSPRSRCCSCRSFSPPRSICIHSLTRDPRKPQTALADPYPAPTVIPKFTQQYDKADYESELAVVIGKPCKNVSESEALDYVLGYTASNDVSSREKQFSQSQWCFSKGFDGACPIGPVLVSPQLVPDPTKFHVRGIKNGKVLQDCGVE